MAQVLIIEREDSVRKLLRYALEREGHTVIEAKYRYEGLYHYRQTPIDVIIADIPLPESQAEEAITELRRECPNARIIAISVLDITKTLKETQTFQKPFELHEFLGAVR
ncbi:MAG: response regulator [Nitrospiraceae bacterium]